MPMTTNPSEGSLGGDSVAFTDVELDVLPQVPEPAGTQATEEQQQEGFNEFDHQQGQQQKQIVLPGGYVVEESEPMGKVVKKVIWASMRCYDGMEFIGGMVAHMLGITQSRYQWVIDTMNDDDVQAAQEDFLVSQNERVLLFDEIKRRDAPISVENREAVPSAPTASAEPAGDDDLEAN